MKNSREIQQAREERIKEKEIKEFNENLKNSPHLLNNELFLFQNMYRLRLKLKQIPPHHLNNVLLMTEYFKTERESVNFKYIQAEILNNRIFLNYAIAGNPELYFLISSENQIIFKSLAISRDREYLKYLNKEDYDNPEVIKKISFNLKGFNESLSCITEENFNKLLSGQYVEYFYRDLLKLKKEQCQYMKNTLESYIEKKKEEKGIFWFKELLNKNPYLYSILNKEKYKDEESKKFLISLTGKYHDLFPELPKEWKEDISIVSAIINDKSETESRYQYHGMKYHENVKNVPLILNEYGKPEKFLATFNDINMTYLRNIYPQLTLEWRQQDTIIKSLFKARDKFEVTLDYCKSIPNESLAENLVAQVKNFKMRTLEEIGETLEKVISYHYMKENLEIKNQKEKKLKI